MPYKFWRRCRRDGLGKRIYLFRATASGAKLITYVHSLITPDEQGRRAQAAGDAALASSDGCPERTG